MKTAGFAFAFALVSGLATYGLLAWCLPELVPTSYLNVVGLVALAGAVVGRIVATRRRAVTSPAPGPKA